MQALVSHMVTSHLRSAVVGVDQTSATMHRLSAAYDEWRSKLHQLLLDTEPRTDAMSARAFGNTGGHLDLFALARLRS